MDMAREINGGPHGTLVGGIEQQIQVCDSGLHEWKDPGNWVQEKKRDQVQSEMCKDAEGENIGKLLNCPFKVINRLTPLK